MDNQEIKEFFHNTTTSIHDNLLLREPQREAYQAIQQHFQESKEACYVQLPVGSGKTGLMGITPFNVTKGRVLIISPNLTIRRTIAGELDISDPNCFYSKRGVFTPVDGPYLSELKTGANSHDCDEAHIVLSNIQQFSRENNKWYEKFPNDYFKMILVDEGHHNVADTWQRLFNYFSEAKIISYTATPFRSDGKLVVGKKIYSFPYIRSMLLGYISSIDSVCVAPDKIAFTAKDTKHELTLEEVLKMREKDWFSRGIALSEQCNKHIAQASIRQLREVKKYGSPRIIIASACTIRHAAQIVAIYEEHGLKTEVLHSQLKKPDRERIEGVLKSGLIDAIVQVQMLGEGYDLGTLSIAAVFRPYRSLSPYIQFIGRILRLAEPTVPLSPANKVYVVSHVGLNDERWWNDFTNFDKEDQEFFAAYFSTSEESLIDSETKTPRMTLRPFMRVLNEIVTTYIQKGYLKKIDETMVQDFIKTIKEKGFDPLEFGLTEELIRQRLKIAAENQSKIEHRNLIAQPQKVREALRKRATQEARSIADTIINRLKINRVGKDMVSLFPGKGPHNSAILIALAQGTQNKKMDIKAGKRDSASKEQFQKAIDSSADIVDEITILVKKKLEEKNAQSKKSS